MTIVRVRFVYLPAVTDTAVRIFRGSTVGTEVAALAGLWLRRRPGRVRRRT